MNWGEDNDDENDDENEENEDESEEWPKSRNDVIMFMIDARPKMRGTNSKGATYLHDCLSVVLAIFKRKIIEDENVLLGITFFGTVFTLL